ncbi:MAG: hypothetical protein A3A33_02870 [Candidatus Yanofskybacteria bacterium RIFCSPLOWO2_01_FULL_49_25]|uniref:GGDEF domain-containing protein n=1 Tax=Candidatus Yanofskybacteria bacterium RIFCSPLOWO2_01_FULL_49_25 TaxID=1802701 RepID=A0A1F8GUS9_9BACT|nr:MAG: hypothetical protein A3A33_02870 [Candidatus Yanofskybacteria bacterium RIFCSPLOWO2_01_FULL_49_25]
MSAEKEFPIKRSPSEKGGVAEEIERIIAQERISIIGDLSKSVAEEIERDYPDLEEKAKAEKREEVLSYLDTYVDKTAKKNTDLKIRGQVDELTGLFKFGMVESLYERSIKYIPEGKVVSLIAFDVDYFKTINDRYGHAEGDKFLIEIGRIIREHIRDFDIGCRKSGDEFFVLLSDVTPDDIRNIMARIAGYIGAIKIASDITSPTISAGCVLVRSGEVLPFQDAFESADKALYISKKERGRFTMIEGPNFAKYELAFEKESGIADFHYIPEYSGVMKDFPADNGKGRE